MEYALFTFKTRLYLCHSNITPTQHPSLLLDCTAQSCYRSMQTKNKMLLFPFCRKIKWATAKSRAFFIPVSRGQICTYELHAQVLRWESFQNLIAFSDACIPHFQMLIVGLTAYSVLTEFRVSEVILPDLTCYRNKNKSQAAKPSCTSTYDHSD